MMIYDYVYFLDYDKYDLLMFIFSTTRTQHNIYFSNWMNWAIHYSKIWIDNYDYWFYQFVSYNIYVKYKTKEKRYFKLHALKNKKKNLSSI